MVRINVWFIALAMIVVTIMGVQGAFGATITWDGSEADGNWDTAANWVGGVAPADATDDVIFPDLDYGGAAQQPVVNVDFTTAGGGIACAPGTSGLIITVNNGWTLGIAAGQSITSTGTQGVTITGAGNLGAAGALTIDNDDAAGLTISTANLNGNGAGLITLSGSEDITVSAIIAGAATPLTVAMDATADVVTLSGANTYTGATTLTDGTLNINGVNTGVSATTANGGILAGTGTIPGAVTMNTGTILAPGANDGDDVGTITIGGNLVFNGASIYRISAAGAAADLIIAGANLTATGNVPTVEMQAGYSIAGLAVNTPIMNITGAYTAFDETNLPAGFDIDDAPVGGLVRFIALPATPAAAVPTLNEWGMILTVLLLGFVGVKLMKKQGQGSGNIAC